MRLTALVQEGETAFVATCPEIDIASQGVTLDEAVKNLQEAVEVYFEEIQDSKNKDSLFDSILNKRFFITSFTAHA